MSATRVEGPQAPRPAAAHNPLTVVMPVYNEAALIEAAVAEVVTSVLLPVPASRLLVVDDGSRDGTARILDSLSAGDPRIVVIHQPNGGHGSALLRALREPLADWTFLIDSDQQIPLDGFLDAWRQREHKQAVFGIRMERRDPLARKGITAVLRWTLQLFFGVTLTDPNVPFKLVSRQVVEQVLKLMPPDALIPSVFIAAYVARRRLDIAFVPVTYRQRAIGEGSLRPWKLIKLSSSAMIQLVAFSLRLRGQHEAPGLTESTVRRAS